MNQDQLAHLWAFARGDTVGTEFEKWFLAQDGLEGPLGKQLHWDLTSSSYADRDEVWRLRQSLARTLEPLKVCECPCIRDNSAIAMGGDFYFEKVFSTLDQVVEYGSEKWWLYISKCGSCGTIWLVAQDDCIYDEFFLKRITAEELAQSQTGKWPDQFQTYEQVLVMGRELSTPPRFLDPMAGSLQWAVEDLVRDRPSIEPAEVGNLLGVSNKHAAKLMRKAMLG